MHWEMKVQKLGRIQIPRSYLKAHDIREGDKAIIEETGEALFINFRREARKADSGKKQMNWQQ